VTWPWTRHSGVSSSLPNGGDAGLPETTLNAEVLPPLVGVVFVEVLELSDSLVSHDYF
jgi:hypothetical protein